MFEILLFALVSTSIVFGWMAGADKAEREAQRAYDRGYADAIRHYGPGGR
jgi:type II secretory pathway pseudopilin PulG